PVLRALAGTVRRAAPASDGFRARLSTLDSAGQLAALTELVRTETAAELGHAGTEEIGAQRPFRELGFDSLTAVGLRNRLTRATGQALPATLIYDHDTPDAVARLLLSTADARSPEPAPAPESGADLAFGQIYRALLERNRLDDMQRLSLGAAATRSTFTEVAELGEGTRTVRLSEGDDPHLICFAPPASMNAALNFSSLSNHFQGGNRLSVLLTPGFDAREPLAATFEVLVEALADAVVRAAADRPFVLLGISAGGVFAHAVAAHLEREGVKPGGVVLLDTYVVGTLPPRLMEFLVDGYSGRPEFWNDYTYAKITASATYTEMIRHWEPQPVLAPTLVLRPTEPPTGALDGGEAPADEEWRTHWPLEHQEVEVPGNHFSMYTTHAATAAAAIHRWLTGLYPGR
ncbi:MAG: thioesterase domain-containing protein, partial [Actinoallomurus sp.]